MVECLVAGQVITYWQLVLTSANNLKGYWGWKWCLLYTLAFFQVVFKVAKLNTVVNSVKMTIKNILIPYKPGLLLSEHKSKTKLDTHFHP